MAGLAEQMERDAGPVEQPKSAGDGSLASRMERDLEVVGGTETAAAAKRTGPTKESATSMPDFTGVEIKGPDHTGAEVAAHVATGIGSSIIGGWRGLATLASGGTLDDAANAVTGEQEARTYQPEGEGGRKAVEVLESPKNPLNWIPIASKKAGEVAQDLGAPPSVATGIEVAGNVAAPAALTKGLRLVGRGSTTEMLPPPKVEPGTVMEERVAPSILRQAEPVVDPKLKVKAATDWDAAQRDLTAAINDPRVELPEIRQLQQKAQAAEKTFKDLEATPEPTVAPAAGASRDRFTTPAEVGEETPRFLDGPPEGGTGPEMNARASILKRVGLTEARKSAVEGNGRDAATDYQVSKLDSAAGRHMSAVLDSEKAALTNYSEGLVRDTGGTIGTDSATMYGRGNAVLAPLEGLNKWFNEKTKELYKQADERAGGQPVNLPKTQEFVGGDRADFLGTTEGESLLKGIQARMRSLGMVDEKGAPQPVTVQQAEQLKQYLNNQWQPRTSRLIQGMKNAIDDDVTLGAGEDIYKAARGMRAMKAAVFENDMDLGKGRTMGNGIAKLFDANGKGVDLKSGVSPENIADRITSMPADQVAHIVKTLKSLPAELQPQGQAALAEIKAQFANKIHDIGSAQQGQWAAKNVSKYLNQKAGQMQQVFTPEEMARYNDLNDAGHIIAKDQSYPGAAAQSHNLLRRGATYLVGEVPVVGKFAASKLSDSMALRDAQKRVINLGDIPE